MILFRTGVAKIGHEHYCQMGPLEFKNNSYTIALHAKLIEIAIFLMGYSMMFKVYLGVITLAMLVALYVKV